MAFPFLMIQETMKEKENSTKRSNTEEERQRQLENTTQMIENKRMWTKSSIQSKVCFGFLVGSTSTSAFSCRGDVSCVASKFSGFVWRCSFGSDVLFGIFGERDNLFPLEKGHFGEQQERILFSLFISCYLVFWLVVWLCGCACCCFCCCCGLVVVHVLAVLFFECDDYLEHLSFGQHMTYLFWLLFLSGGCCFGGFHGCCCRRQLGHCFPTKWES